MEATHRSYVDEAVTATRTILQAEINGKTVMIKAELQQQLNAVKESIGESLQAMKGQIVEVQKSQEKMWGAISQMGEELRELTAREIDSDSEHEEEAALEDSPVETATSHNLAPPVIQNLGDPIPLWHASTLGAWQCCECEGFGQFCYAKASSDPDAKP